MNLIKDTDSENKERDILASLLLLMIFHYFCALGSNTIPLSKCTAHTFNQLVRSVVFDLGIDVHCNLAALMACQVLYCFGVYR